MLMNLATNAVNVEKKKKDGQHAIRYCINLLPHDINSIISFLGEHATPYSLVESRDKSLEVPRLI